MSSDRPRTPPRSGLSFGEVQFVAAKSTNAKPIQPVPGYIPNVFDLVHPGRDGISLTKQHIPPVFLEAEAVDSLVFLGHGASFTASLQKIPKGPKKVEVTTHLEGWSVTKSQPAPPRPNYVVYKTARVAFDKKGEPLPEYRRALQSVLTDFHALISTALFNHPNVIDFLGMAWESIPILHSIGFLLWSSSMQNTERLGSFCSESQVQNSLSDICCASTSREVYPHFMDLDWSMAMSRRTTS